MRPLFDEVLDHRWYHYYVFCYGSIRALTNAHTLIDEQFCLRYPDILPARNRDRLFHDFASHVWLHFLPGEGEGEIGTSCRVSMRSPFGRGRANVRSGSWDKYGIGEIWGDWAGRVYKPISCWGNEVWDKLWKIWCFTLCYLRYLDDLAVRDYRGEKSGVSGGYRANV